MALNKTKASTLKKQTLTFVQEDHDDTEDQDNIKKDCNIIRDKAAKEQTPLRTVLQSCKLGELKRRAKTFGISAAQLEECDDDDDPKTRVIGLIIAAERKKSSEGVGYRKLSRAGTSSTKLSFWRDGGDGDSGSDDDEQEEKDTWSDAAAEFLMRFYRPIEPFLYPITPKTTSSFVTFLFWHSFLLTVTTPAARLLRGRWMGVLTCQWLLNMVGLGDITKQFRDPELVYNDSLFVYGDEETHTKLDLPFALHAGFGMMWLVVAYLQMVPVRKWSLKLHRKFGYFALLSYLGHVLAALNLLHFDEAHHHPMNRMILLSPLLTSFTYMVHAIIHARKGDAASHTDETVRAFLYSIEGAGTIRTIATFQGFLTKVLPVSLAGPGPCQRQFAGRAGECLASYATRLVLIRLLTLFWIGMYARIKKDVVFTKVYVLELCFTWIVNIALMYVLATSHIKYLDGVGEGWYAVAFYRLVVGAYYMFPLFQVEAKQQYIKTFTMAGTRVCNMASAKTMTVMRQMTGTTQPVRQCRTSPPVKSSHPEEDDFAKCRKLQEWYVDNMMKGEEKKEN